MGSELEFNIGLAKFRIALEDFVSATDTLAGAATGGKALADVRTAIKELIEEVGRNYGVILKAMTPLIAMDTPQKFEAGFGALRAGATEKFWKQYEAEGTRCRIVMDKMEVLRKKRAWMAKLPVVRGAFRRLETLCQDWIAIDVVLDLNMQDFRDKLKALLDDLAKTKAEDPEAAYAALQGVLASLDTDFNKMKACLNDLDRVSAKL